MAGELSSLERQARTYSTSKHSAEARFGSDLRVALALLERAAKQMEYDAAFADGMQAKVCLRDYADAMEGGK